MQFELQKLIIEGKKDTIIQLDDNYFLIKDKTTKFENEVNLTLKICSCHLNYKLQFPCKHLAAYISIKNMNFNQFYHKSYTVSYLKSIYQG
jgi:hypothetical protein